MKDADEEELRRSWRDGDFHAVAELVFKRYGQEIVAALVARLRSEADAKEVFSIFIMDLLDGLAGFQWRCSLRAWAHRIARNAAVRWASAGARSPDRNLSIEQAGVFDVAERVRSSTMVHLRTEVKSAIRRLREELPAHDQVLLMLRVDRGLEWEDIASVLADHDLSDDELKREAARLRKRLQLVTKKLRRLAHERGLLDPE